jgi:ATP-dependent DNA ligase
VLSEHVVDFYRERRACLSWMASTTARRPGRAQETAGSTGRPQARGIIMNQHTDARGELVFEQACRMGLEGIVSKRLSAAYQSGPSRHWLKIKNPDSPASGGELVTARQR